MIEVVYLAARGCSSAQPSSRAAAAAAAAAVDVDASLRSWGEAERRRAKEINEDKYNTSSGANVLYCFDLHVAHQK